jgi:hypothetical protein
MARTGKQGPRWHPTGALPAGALVGIGLLAAACGGGSHPSGVASLGKPTSSSAVAGASVTTAPSGAAVEKHFRQMLEFSECMRSHGVAKFPDPTSTGGIDFGSGSGIDPNSPQFQAASEACQKYVPIPNLSKAQIAENEASALKFAACMRASGVPNFPDPQFFSNGSMGVKPVPGVSPNSPTYQAASKKCGGS